MGPNTELVGDALSCADPVTVDTEIRHLRDEAQKCASRTRSITAVHARQAAAGMDTTSTDVELAELNAVAENLRAERRVLEDEAQRRRWARYYIVTPNGHVHSSTHCVTCYPTTVYYWLVELSGSGVAEMIEEWGERACTVCFPDAPTYDAFSGPGRRDAAMVAEREQQKLERDAVKAAKTLRADEVFTDLRGDKVRTVAAVKATLRYIAEIRTLAGTRVDHNGYYAGLAARSPDLEAAARTVLAGRYVGADECDTIIERAVKKTLREYDLV